MKVRIPAVALVFAVSSPLPALACSACRSAVFAAVFSPGFAVRLLVLLSPIALLTGLAIWLHASRDGRMEGGGQS